MKKRIRKYRRLFHRYPEIGWLTWFSSVFIAEQLDQMGYEILVGNEIFHGISLMDFPSEEENRRARQAAQIRLLSYMPEERIDYWFKRHDQRTGLTAFIQGKQGPGNVHKLKVYRFDMDALMVEESQSEDRIPIQEGFSSEIAGQFHACGHDGHMALGLTLAHYIAEHIDTLSNDYMLIFQPAEEGVRGAVGFCHAWEQYGCKKIDELYCCHIGFAPEDTLVAGAEGFLATSKFDVSFLGKSAHAGLAPERGKNALMAATRAAVWMEEIERPEGGISRLNVGQMRAGESRNTIPERAWMQIETRGATIALNQYMKEAALDCIAKAAAAYGVTYEVEWKGESVNARSSQALTEKVYELAFALQNTEKEETVFRNCLQTYPFAASDDGAVMMDYVQKSGGQAVYMLLGCKLRGLHHEREFDFDEKVLERALAIYQRTL